MYTKAGHYTDASTLLTVCCLLCCAMLSQVAEGSGLSPVGEVLLVPDLSSAVDIPWCTGSSMSAADMMEKDLSESQRGGFVRCVYGVV